MSCYDSSCTGWAIVLKCFKIGTFYPQNIVKVRWNVSTYQPNLRCRFPAVNEKAIFCVFQEYEYWAANSVQIHTFCWRRLISPSPTVAWPFERACMPLTCSDVLHWHHHHHQHHHHQSTRHFWVELTLSLKRSQVSVPLDMRDPIREIEQNYLCFLFSRTDLKLGKAQMTFLRLCFPTLQMFRASLFAFD